MPGDVAVDATLGNGNDAAFLASRTGANGHVFGFDVQPSALLSSRKRLEQCGIPEARFTLFEASHHLMGAALPKHVLGAIAAVVFNLGYLPGGDKSRATGIETTLPALDCALTLLKTGGVLSVTAYRGHPGGMEEADAVRMWMESLEPGLYEVQQWKAVNRLARAPVLWLVMRLR
jgi:SAM-dependent methyltransferase